MLPYFMAEPPMPPERPDQPLVSVVIRTKDRRETLQYALGSCLGQHYRPLELVVVNDGGVEVGDLVTAVASDSVRTRYLSHPASLGRCAAGNAGLDLAGGDYLVFLDDDDWFEPDHVSALVAALAAHPDVLAACAGVRYCTAPGEPHLHLFDAEYDPVAQRLENRLPIHAVLFSRRLLELGCRLDGDLEVFEDWDFWLQCARFTSFVRVDQISAGYRAGGGSHAGWGQDAARVALARQRLLAKWRLLWSVEELDQALRWPQERLVAVQAQLGRAMEAHRDLHQQHSELRDTYVKLHADHVDLHRAWERKNADFARTRAALEALELQQADLVLAHAGLESLHQELSRANRLLRAEHGELVESHKRLAFVHRELAQAHAATLASTSWRLTAPLRAVSLAVQWVDRNARAMLAPVVGVLTTVADARRVSGGWRRLGGKVAVRLRQDGLSGAIRRVRFHMLRVGGPALVFAHAEQPVFRPTPQQLAARHALRCGIMVHVFYLELFPELCSYLARMPVRYSLLVSVTSEQDRARILDQRALAGDLAELCVKVVPNRGRDIAPLLVAFREEIAGLDIIGHLHTKRSSYAGAPLFGERWRRYLCDAMLGDGARVRAVLAQFAADPGVGIIYPETFPGLPYWAHTWLSNRAQASGLLNGMGYGDLDFGQYIDYPAGSMFWARTQALRPLFDLGFALADFPPEQGQTDNTLHHAVERCLVFAAQAAGFSRRIQYQEGDHTCFASYSPFVLDQYAPGAVPERVRMACQGAPLVSFDLFDTLLWRPFARPEAVFWMLGEQVESAFGITDFARKRHEAEATARQTLGPGRDIGIAQIYRCFTERFGVAPELASRLMALEVATEQSLLRPNPVIAPVVHELRATVGRMLLVSDMYLGESYLRPVLQRLDLDCFDRWYVSADTGRRKDRGDVWDHLLGQEGIEPGSLLHVGDNEQSDVQVLVDRGFPHPVHLMRPAALLGVLPGGQALIRSFRRRPSWRNELVLGLVANRVSLALGRGGDPRRPFADPHVFGYGILGPIVFVFMAWLIRRARRDRVTSLGFLSREGWLLEQVYRRMRGHAAFAGLTDALPPGRYLYCSRSVFGLAAVRREADLDIFLSSHYDGSLSQFLSARLGLTDLGPIVAELGESVLEQPFRLPEDRYVLASHLRRCLPALLAESERLRALVQAYWASCLGADDGHPAIVDLGYSGTIQLGLMQVIGQAVQGYYFVTNASAGRILERGGDCASCFGHLLPLERMNDEPIHRYSLLLESVLTSPEGQLAGFTLVDGRPLPRFRPGGTAQSHFPTLQLVHDGVGDFCDDILDVLGAERLDGDWDLDAIAGLVPLVVERVLDIGSLSASLSVEDQYCGNDELSVLDFYDRLRTLTGDV